MGTTNSGFHYPSSGDLVRNFPAAQEASQKALDSKLTEAHTRATAAKAATDAATPNNTGAALVRRSSTGTANFQSLWVAEVPANTGSVVNKRYVDDRDAATLAAAKEYADQNGGGTGGGVTAAYVDDRDAATLAAAKEYADDRTTVANLPELPASKISSGTFASARLPSGTAALLNTGTSTLNYGWSPKVLADFVKANAGGGGWTPPAWIEGTAGADSNIPSGGYARIRVNGDGTATIALRLTTTSWPAADTVAPRVIAEWDGTALPAELTGSTLIALALELFDEDWTSAQYTTAATLFVSGSTAHLSVTQPAQTVSGPGSAIRTTALVPTAT